MAVSGDAVVVGANKEDAGGDDAGAAYVFERDAGGTGNWAEVGKLTAFDAEALDEFGWSVAVSGDTAVVGAHNEGSGGNEAGAAYVFQEPVPTPTPCPPEGCPVGGIAELPDVAGLPLKAEGSSGPSSSLVAAIAAATGVLALGSAAWYARRRWG